MTTGSGVAELILRFSSLLDKTFNRGPVSVWIDGWIEILCPFQQILPDIFVLEYLTTTLNHTVKLVCILLDKILKKTLLQK